MNWLKKLALQWARSAIQGYLDETASKTPTKVDDIACEVLLHLVDAFLGGDLGKAETAALLRRKADELEKAA